MPRSKKRDGSRSSQNAEAVMSEVLDAISELKTDFRREIEMIRKNNEELANSLRQLNDSLRVEIENVRKKADTATMAEVVQAESNTIRTPPETVNEERFETPDRIESEARMRSNDPITKMFLRGNAVAKYTGSDSKMSTQAWLALYEDVSEGLSSRIRVKSLPMYLVDDAIDWYAEEIAQKSLSWNETCEKLLARYGTATVPYSVAAEQRRMTSTDSVHVYAQEKMRLCKLAGYSLESSIALLTFGAHSNYHSNLFAQNPKTFDEWLRIALTIENSIQSNYLNEEEPVNEIVNLAGQNNRKKLTKKPRECKLCKALDIEAFHWFSECPNLPNKNMDNF